MSYNKHNYIRIMEERRALISKETLEAERRKRELCAGYPELGQIDSALQETSYKLVGEIGRGKEGLEERIKKLKEENLELQRARAEFLESCGYPADYTDVKYRCELCRDTGFRGVRMCECLRRELVLAGYESSGIGALIGTQNFDNFDPGYHKDDPAAYAEMKKILSACRKYAENFAENSSRNMLFMGGTGLGKTHLCSAVAKTVIDGGSDVVYCTAQELLGSFEVERFGRGQNADESDTGKYFDCDLLIIDDLGTEVSNQFTVSCIYNVINTRLCRKKAVIVNTNLSGEELRRRYGDRLVSRFFGDFDLVLFKGRDVRIRKGRKD